MSGMPSWASTEPSTYSTIEWTMLCGWTMTDTCAVGKSNNQRASMTSNPLFISVAESIVILSPIFHVGCCSASATRMPAKSSAGRCRNGPPDAVRMIRLTSAWRWPCRAWNTALCSLSTGRSCPPRLAASRVINSPDTTSASLLASATSLPARTAASVEGRPSAPTSAATTRSAGACVATSCRPSAPHTTSPP